MSVSIVVMGANGRMGATIARMAQDSDKYELAAVVGRKEHEERLNIWGCEVSNDLDVVLDKIDNAVVIDFTVPAASLANAKIAAKHNTPIVMGTTGFTIEERAQLEELAKTSPMFWAPNTSVGISALTQILPELIKILGEDYDLEMVELHHNKKKDSPSGTAMRLAECLAEAKKWDLDKVANYHREGIIGERPKEEIGIQTIRGGDVVGVHTVYAMGPGERIEVTHHAHSRETFAAGALRAAYWLAGRDAGKLYSMSDII
ncbi:4-hydroxy-tetrahydrodipicolinate reductase [Halodesulfovibrio aestuarii]|uniref:4-hydroxy-tetrahydrodipicolinate reductase n=1 Tax=Halodesulfovibrio aestuarii TaxID=126333 RepID=A0A8G2C7N9_9BACT|nr:4-hydroxy-tetrahydrodipicolinate reductase [Halodesulfovibrio aestuarii]SHI67773.1 dihydrodipicolinate reductase [Halodesulfovibrio aestuarii]